MNAGLLVYLIITFQNPGERAYVEKTQMPDPITCSVKAAHALWRASQVQDEDAHRFTAECMLEWPGHDPA